MADRKYPGPTCLTIDDDDDRSVDRCHLFTYDRHGNILTEELIPKTEGWNNTSTSYRYDQDGKLLEKITFIQYERGTVEYRITYTYDEHGNVLTIEHYNSDSDMVSVRVTYTYEYDENGIILTAELSHSYANCEMFDCY